MTITFSGKATGKKGGPEVRIFLNIARRQAVDFCLFRFTWASVEVCASDQAA